MGYQGPKPLRNVDWQILGSTCKSALGDNTIPLIESIFPNLLNKELTRGSKYRKLCKKKKKMQYSNTSRKKDSISSEKLLNDF
jgi:hypothetical protein